MTNGDYLRDRGCEIVEINNKQFVDAMRFNAKMIARQKGKVSCDELRELAGELNLKPVSPNAWGAIFRTKCFKCMLCGKEMDDVDKNKPTLAKEHKCLKETLNRRG